MCRQGLIRQPGPATPAPSFLSTVSMRTHARLVFSTLYSAVTVSSLGRYIVEVSDVKVGHTGILYIARGRKHQHRLTCLQAIDQVKESISQDPSCYQAAQLNFRHVYENAIFPGFSLEINSPDDPRDYSSCLGAIGGVVKVWQSRPYVPASQTGNPAQHAGDEPPGPPVNSSVLHGSTGVKELHDMDITGSEITVAVVDTGLDYLHPALGGGVGAGFKVRFGIDLVGDDFKVGLPPRPRSDPYAECLAHGTHVSGIVAGNQSSTGFVGVAPAANLEHYRVVGCHKIPIQSDMIIQAVLMAQAREVDVLSLSLTLDSGPYPDGTSLVITNLQSHIFFSNYQY